MSFNLRNRSFLKELDFTPAELKFLLRLSADLKAAKYGGYEQPRLGSGIPYSVPRGTYRCADGLYICSAATPPGASRLSRSST